MITLSALALLTLPALPARDDAAQAFATIDASELVVGGRYEILVGFELEDGASLSAGAITAPILQIDVPPSIKLSGRYLETYAELSRNEFLQEPYERLLEELPARIPFELVAEPGPKERIGLVLTGYVKDGANERFLRTRLELPVQPMVDAEEGKRTNSRWGKDEKILQIGDEFADFTLPKSDGSTLRLADLVGKSNVIVTTYRAFW